MPLVINVLSVNDTPVMGGSHCEHRAIGAERYCFSEQVTRFLALQDVVDKLRVHHNRFVHPIDRCSVQLHCKWGRERRRWWRGW